MLAEHYGERIRCFTPPLPNLGFGSCLESGVAKKMVTPKAGPLSSAAKCDQNITNIKKNFVTREAAAGLEMTAPSLWGFCSMKAHVHWRSLYEIVLAILSSLLALAIRVISICVASPKVTRASKEGTLLS
jgi:hypothetical protein